MLVPLDFRQIDVSILERLTYSKIVLQMKHSLILISRRHIPAVRAVCDLIQILVLDYRCVFVRIVHCSRAFGDLAGHSYCRSQEDFVIIP